MIRKVIPLVLLCFFKFTSPLPATVSRLASAHSTTPKRPVPVAIVRGTDYHATAAECDADPLTTASGKKINLRRLHAGLVRWVGVSHDLHRETSPRGIFSFGDTIRVSSRYPEINGYWIVQDLMNQRHRKRIDFLRPGRKSSNSYTDVKLFKI